MSGNVPPVANEREALSGYLAQQRYVLRLTAFGLDDEQARLVPTTSALSIGGLLKHVSAAERFWMDLVEQRVDVGADARQYEDNFRFGANDTLSGVLDAYEQTASQTAGIIESIGDLGQSVPIPHSVPWFPKDVDAWSVRWVLLHLIEETARHAGHADFIREAIDGATAFPLMAAVEHWPPSPWVEAWKPAA